MDSLAVTAQDLRLDSYAAAACLTLLTYDTFLNLALEYRHIWRSKWNLIKCLYLWSRYGTFLEIGVDVLMDVNNVNLHPSACAALYKFITMYSGFGIAITEIIMMARTYALYGKSKKVLGFFVIMWVSIGASSYLKEILAYQIGKAFKSPRLLTNFYRDGILFYVAMLLCLVLVVALQSDAPEALKPIGHAPLRAIHSILACHLVVHIRVVASEDENSTTIKTPIVFANFSVESGRRIDSAV
ncbi:hypothetical protein C8R45DRAFT_1102571 [Mycena sanguinolenta]|nr:hypothetical protein C8R45DRAFT_1102571 [Mycena sanguinolenta]